MQRLKYRKFCFGRYTWKKDNKDLETGHEIKMLPGIGTIQIEFPRKSHEGVYQCFASNSYGVAISIKSILKQAGIYT